MSKKARNRTYRPIAREKGQLPPSPGGNRQQRRLAGKLQRAGRTVAPKPAGAEEMLQRIGEMPDWKTVEASELGRRLGLHPNKARAMRRILLEARDQ